jgi:hypothetical protein
VSSDLEGSRAEARFVVLDELDGLRQRRHRVSVRLGMGTVPGVLICLSAVLVWDLPGWVVLCVAAVSLGLPLLYVLGTGEGRGTRADWRRIQHLERELRFLNSFGRLDDDDRKSLDLS